MTTLLYNLLRPTQSMVCVILRLNTLSIQILPYFHKYNPCAADLVCFSLRIIMQDHIDAAGLVAVCGWLSSGHIVP